MSDLVVKESSLIKVKKALFTHTSAYKYIYNFLKAHPERTLESLISEGIIIRKATMGLLVSSFSGSLGASILLLAPRLFEIDMVTSLLSGATATLVTWYGGRKLLDKTPYTKDGFFTSLTQEERTQALVYIKRNEKVCELDREYKADHEKFIAKYFGVYTPDLSIVIKHAYDMDKTGTYLLDIINPESEKHQALQARVSVRRLS